MNKNYLLTCPELLLHFIIVMVITGEVNPVLLLLLQMIGLPTVDVTLGASEGEDFVSEGHFPNGNKFLFLFRGWRDGPSSTHNRLAPH